MENHWLGIHSGTIWTVTTSKNNQKYIKTYSVDLPNWPKYLGYFKKSYHWVSVVRVCACCSESKSKKRGLKKCSTAACHRQLWPQLIQNDFSSKFPDRIEKRLDFFRDGTMGPFLGFHDICNKTCRKTNCVFVCFLKPF